jgi:hypothetical protein
MDPLAATFPQRHILAYNNKNNNKKFWEELIRLLSIHTLLHAVVAIVTLAKDVM